MDPDLEERIRERAYALWVQDGREHGRAEDFWYRAEQEIRAEDGRAGAEDASVYAVPDSEMLTGEPDAGQAPGGPTVAALGTAPVAPAKALRGAGKSRAAATSDGAPAEPAVADTSAGRAGARQTVKGARATRKTPGAK